MSDKKLVVWPYFFHSASIILAFMGGFMGITWAENLVVFYAVVLGTTLLVCLFALASVEDAARRPPDKKSPGANFLFLAFSMILAASGHLILAIYVFIPGSLFYLLCKHINRKTQS